VLQTADDDEMLRADVARLEAECRKLRDELDAQRATSRRAASWLRRKIRRH
jgi:hypothetical protein